MACFFTEKNFAGYVAFMMKLIPVRLNPGEDLRKTLDALPEKLGFQSAFLVSAIGSLQEVRIRFANQQEPTHFRGFYEILSMNGCITSDGGHYHMLISDSSGRVYGGHLCLGSIVYTTVELALAPVEGFTLTRKQDSRTGFLELDVKRNQSSSDEGI